MSDYGDSDEIRDDALATRHPDRSDEARLRDQLVRAVDERDYLKRVLDVVWKYCEERNDRAVAYLADGNRMAGLVLTKEELIFNDAIKEVMESKK